MDLVQGTEKRFASVLGRAKRRLSHGPRAKSKIRQGQHEDPAERLMDKIQKASENRPSQKAAAHGK
jgi:hypothetical protein